MAVTIPQPLFIPGGQDRRPAAEQFLLTLLQQTPDIGFSIANLAQEGSQRKQADESAQAVLQGLFESGTIDPSFASAINGFNFQQPQQAQQAIPLQGNISGPAAGAIPGKPGGFQGEIPIKGAAQLLTTLQGAQQAQSNIEQARATTESTIRATARADELQPYKIKESKSATGANDAAVAWNLCRSCDSDGQQGRQWRHGLGHGACEAGHGP